MPKVVTGVFKGILLFMLLAGETLTGLMYASPCRTAPERRRVMLEQLLLTVLMTSIPLIFAATGELVAERSGVLNLGVEGMMLMGAVSAFALPLGLETSGWRSLRAGLPAP